MIGAGSCWFEASARRGTWTVQFVWRRVRRPPLLGGPPHPPAGSDGSPADNRPQHVEPVTMARRAVLWAVAFLCLLAGLGSRLARAQTVTPADAAPAAAPASTAAQATREAAPNRPAPTQLAPVEVRSGTVDDTQLRRQSTAGKITVGRDEIERYGDSTVGDLLKRLPDVTTQAAPGAAAHRACAVWAAATRRSCSTAKGAARLRHRLAQPRADRAHRDPACATAETGARAIAGTINIITREGFNKSSMTCASRPRSRTTHCSRACLGRATTASNGLATNYSLSLFRNDRRSDSVTTTESFTLPATY